MKLEYFVMKAATGAYLRFSREGMPRFGPILVESGPEASGPDDQWVVVQRIPPESAGYVSHNLALLAACALVFGQHGGFVKGSRADIEALSGLLGRLD